MAFGNGIVKMIASNSVEVSTLFFLCLEDMREVRRRDITLPDTSLEYILEEILCFPYVNFILSLYIVDNAEKILKTSSFLCSEA